MTAQQSQKILDVLAELIGDQYGCEVKFTVKPKEGNEDEVKLRREVQLANAEAV